MCLSSELLRVRQEALSAVRNPGAMEAHLPSAGSSSSQRRKQGLPQHRDAHFSERRYLWGFGLCRSSRRHTPPYTPPLLILPLPARPWRSPPPPKKAQAAGVGG
ncbi:sterile alpha motif domain-containing protein 11 [Tachysurus ichikawai]